MKQRSRLGSGIAVSPAYRIVSISILTAVTAVFTLLIRIPIAPTRGYINLGDVAIYFTAFTFGPVTAVITAGLGTAIADLLSGYAQWAPISLFIHGLQGFFAGLIVRRSLLIMQERLEKNETETPSIPSTPSPNRYRLSFPVILLAGLVGLIIMTGFYFLAGAALVGFGAAAVEIPGNIIQCVVGTIGGFLLTKTVIKAYPPVRDMFL
ncbi:MAG: ECF transporter S component [Spirochaetia bacterium]|nr:ECF transporter S component [Spirochaetia bacterium]